MLVGKGGAVGNEHWGYEMPLGVLTEDEFETEVKELDRGRGLGQKNIPMPVRKIIQETTLENGRKKGVELAKSFGVSPSSVSAYKRGETGLGQPKNPELVGQLNEIKSKISTDAALTVSRAIGYITPEKMKDLSANKVAVLARDLSAVVKTMSPEDQAQVGFGPNFIIYAPKMKSEDAYEVIESGE
jgi:DNA-binding transcriptional regulator YdaS (Cro superfamily)